MSRFRHFTFGGSDSSAPGGGGGTDPPAPILPIQAIKVEFELADEKEDVTIIQQILQHLKKKDEKNQQLHVELQGQKDENAKLYTALAQISSMVDKLTSELVAEKRRSATMASSIAAKLQLHVLTCQDLIDNGLGGAGPAAITQHSGEGPSQVVTEALNMKQWMRRLFPNSDHRGSNGEAMDSAPASSSSSAMME